MLRKAKKSTDGLSDFSRFFCVFTADAADWGVEWKIARIESFKYASTNTRFNGGKYFFACFCLDTWEKICLEKWWCHKKLNIIFVCFSLSLFLWFLVKTCLFVLFVTINLLFILMIWRHSSNKKISTFCFFFFSLISQF